MDRWKDVDEYVVLLETNEADSNMTASNKTYQGVSNYSDKAFGDKRSWDDDLAIKPVSPINSMIWFAIRDHLAKSEKREQEFSFTVRVSAEFDGWQQTADVDLTVNLRNDALLRLSCA